MNSHSMHYFRCLNYNVQILKQVGSLIMLSYSACNSFSEYFLVIVVNLVVDFPLNFRTVKNVCVLLRID